MTIYDDVYCDIGDDQSITSNLSTFSSHLSKIIDILNNVTNRSLVLFDEIGSGTDPIEGSSLAIAILTYLLDRNICFITTTHYSKLKIFGFNDSRVINASMEFDAKKLAALDDRALADLIYEVTRSMGMKEAKARQMAQNAPALRVMLSKASDKELRRIVSAVGEDKAAAILSNLNQKEKQ